MNTKLVDSLVQIIQSLTSEEKNLLEEKLHSRNKWEIQRKKLQEIHAQILARRGGKPLNISSEEISELIHQMRDERTQQIMEAVSPLEEIE